MGGRWQSGAENAKAVADGQENGRMGLDMEDR
jgi:hypothetical protein